MGRDARVSQTRPAVADRGPVHGGSARGGLPVHAVGGVRLPCRLRRHRRPCGTESGLPPAAAFGPLPFNDWIEGLLAQALHGARGHLGYLFGERGSGWWWFYLAALALKTTIGAQLLAALAAGGVGPLAPRPRRSCRRRRASWPSRSLLVVVMSLGKAQNGIKYILPAFPFAMLWLGRGLPDVRRAFGRRGLAPGGARGGRRRVAGRPSAPPDVLQPVGGRTGGRAPLPGQRRRLGAGPAPAGRMAARDAALAAVLHLLQRRPRHWGITYEPPPCAPQPGYYALHAVEVHRPKRVAPGCLDWLTVEPPDARLGLLDLPLPGEQGRASSAWPRRAGRPRRSGEAAPREGRREPALRTSSGGWARAVPPWRPCWRWPWASASTPSTMRASTATRPPPGRPRWGSRGARPFPPGARASPAPTPGRPAALFFYLMAVPHVVTPHPLAGGVFVALLERRRAGAALRGLP